MAPQPPNTPSLALPQTECHGLRQLGRYQILGFLGAGGMGTVYKALDPVLDRVVAVKVPKFDGTGPEQTELRGRFLREARAAAVVRHPRICPIYDTGEQDGLAFVVMPCLDGRSLAQLLREEPTPLPITRAVSLARRVVDPLQAIHDSGIVHRDLKPSNILLDPGDEPIVMDFGLAWVPGDPEHFTGEGRTVGTPAYMAPEQVSGRHDHLGPWTDVYGLGVILYQLLTGAVPFQGSVGEVFAGILRSPPPPPSGRRPDLDAALEGIVLRALAKPPAARYQRAADLGHALEKWAAQPTLVAASRPDPAADGRPPADPGEELRSRARYVGLRVQVAGDATVVSFADRELLDDRTVTLLREEILSLVATAGPRLIVVDCGNVRYSSAAVTAVAGPLVHLRKEVLATGGTLQLCNLRPDVRELFRAMKLDRVFDIQPG